jgi:dihydrofolate reductase
MTTLDNVSIIVATAKNGAIGLRNQLLYRLPNDLKRFKALTTGHTIIMGRKTFDSLPKGALPNRRNIVLTRQQGLNIPGVEIFHSLPEALEACAMDAEVFIMGGEAVYTEGLAHAERLYLTHVHNTPAQADAFFPEISAEAWTETETARFEADEKNECPYSFTTYVRK